MFKYFLAGFYVLGIYYGVTGRMDVFELFVIFCLSVILFKLFIPDDKKEK